jgi:hypothetical protein
VTQQRSLVTHDVSQMTFDGSLALGPKVCDPPEGLFVTQSVGHKVIYRTCDPHFGSHVTHWRVTTVGLCDPLVGQSVGHTIFF